MPGGDRTGPMGMGEMTGRQAGYCAGANGPGYANAGFGAGRGFGFFGRGSRGGAGRGRGFFGGGAGRGFARGGAFVPQAQENTRALEIEINTLKAEIEALKNSNRQ